MTNNESGNGLCSSSMGGEECAEYKNFAFLLVSLGITAILVGALFYYVKQRFEVLEVSHKEQIGVMRNFIASISDQFQRMGSMNSVNSVNSVNGGGALASREHQINEPGSSAFPTITPHNLRDRNEDRVSISDDSDSDYDDNDSDSSDTDIMDAYRIGSRNGGSNDIVFCNDGDNDDDDATNIHINDMSDIKIIEICHGGKDGEMDDENRHAGNAINYSDYSDDSDDSDDGDSDDGDSDDNDRGGRNTDTDADADADALDSTEPKRMIVIKTDNVVPDDAEAEDDVRTPRNNNRNMVIDLDLDVVDLSLGNTSSGVDPTDASAPASASATHKTYAEMSIKQLRQSVKRLSEHANKDISKLKRDQLLALLI